MARPIPKAILSQTSDSLGITGHFVDSSYEPMFDGAKKCPEMNSDSRLGIMPLQNLELGQAAAAADFGNNLVKNSREQGKKQGVFAEGHPIFKFCPKFVNSVLNQGISREFVEIS
jgi:hypothetical protein